MLSRRAQENMTWFKSNFGRQIGNASPNAPKAIDMTIAENWLVREEIIQSAKLAVEADFSDEHLSYSSGLGGDKDVLEATAGFFNRFFEPRVPVRLEHVVTGAGCSSILDSLLYSICEENDGVLIEAPFWGSFSAYSILRNNVHLVPVYVSQGKTMVESYEEAMRASPYKIKAVLFCNPQNPRGDIYSAESIADLLRFCQTQDLHFISDEIYALSTFDVGAESRLCQVLQMDLSEIRVDMARIHILYSVSKDLGSSGLRMGFLITQDNPHLRFAMSIYNNAKVSNLTAVVVKYLFSDHAKLDQIIQNNVRNLHAAAKVMLSFMQQNSIPYCQPVAGVFVWARLGGAGATEDSDIALQKRFVDAGVRVGPGWEYAEREHGWFRVTFAIPRPQLLEGLRRIKAAMDGTLSESFSQALHIAG
ncbi:hypothetical protein BBP40_000613 [Aspergillus hancockii]|nr:hypothetical protein BBP40_000613 [Aspergillus hancockii]